MAVTLPRELEERFEKEIADNKVMIYMKGTPDFPMCGFSAGAVQPFKEMGVPVGYVNVLEDPEVWEAIKVFSGWDTIPQVFVDGEFIGGCDITQELYESGELQKQLNAALGRS